MRKGITCSIEFNLTELKELMAIIRGSRRQNETYYVLYGKILLPMEEGQRIHKLRMKVSKTQTSAPKKTAKFHCAGNSAR